MTMRQVYVRASAEDEARAKAREGQLPRGGDVELGLVDDAVALVGIPRRAAADPGQG